MNEQLVEKLSALYWSGVDLPEFLETIEKLMVRVKCEYIEDEKRCIHRNEDGYCSLDEILVDVAENFYAICENCELEGGRRGDFNYG